MTDKKVSTGKKSQADKDASADNHIKAELRENFGKGYARRLRAEGRIPAVLYGHGTAPQHVSVPAHEVGLLLRKANAILDLNIAGKKQLALVKDVQKDPVRQIIEHLDLVIVKKGEKVHVEVPIHLEGESFSGTIAMLEVNTIRVEADATNIPERIVIDIEGAEDGTKIHAADAVLPEGSTLMDEPDLLLVNVIVPAAVSLGEPTEGEAAEEVEGEAAAEAGEAADEAPAEAAAE
ncbi:large subunit ribosomal protein L25 [Cryobacterium mesophilum]|uniref:Large ribosomal subunit protein bL25 n=1 Tax=Terrimesophilobacter mesophilus TaxID=433647 RepID=A0A4R8VE33_9MICO|nr:50S ribosomal protein L25/general stress protein Ctc [Terrimesophilobacter mesophilus]MBB5633729.1 large subunit ribosomal protein L25 [Terrimesophilobacter mesophilus]TFB80412.1 50S ribosomal protein L25/general stress protein Ctc [Terrimesophilobacter mesophilus]